MKIFPSVRTSQNPPSRTATSSPKCGSTLTLPNARTALFPARSVLFAWPPKKTTSAVRNNGSDMPTAALVCSSRSASAQQRLAFSKAVDTKIILGALLVWIANDQQAFLAVEHTAFVAFCRALSPQVVLLSADTVYRRLMSR
ncbi:hypothetical protein CF319_g9146 [Tilletia indica]|nr:hypothetical protein CF319_g9146 [Tilletia indica]